MVWTSSEEGFDHIGKWILGLLPCRRSKERQKRKCMDVVRVSVREEDAEDRVEWRQIIRCDDTRRGRRRCCNTLKTFGQSHVGHCVISPFSFNYTL